MVSGKLGICEFYTLAQQTDRTSLWTVFGKLAICGRCNLDGENTNMDWSSWLWATHNGPADGWITYIHKYWVFGNLWAQRIVRTFMEIGYNGGCAHPSFDRGRVWIIYSCQQNTIINIFLSLAIKGTVPRDGGGYKSGINQKVSLKLSQARHEQLFH